jgi:hypothetical protein
VDDSNSSPGTYDNYVANSGPFISFDDTSISIRFSQYDDGLFGDQVAWNFDVAAGTKVKPVPLPAGLPLLLVGLAAIGGLAATRRHRG